MDKGILVVVGAIASVLVFAGGAFFLVSNYLADDDESAAASAYSACKAREYGRAEEFFRKAIAQAGRHNDPAEGLRLRNELANVLVTLKNWRGLQDECKTGVTLCNRELARDGDNKSTLLSQKDLFNGKLALAFQRLGKSQEAAMLYKEILDGPDSSNLMSADRAAMAAQYAELLRTMPEKQPPTASLPTGQ